MKGRTVRMAALVLIAFMVLPVFMGVLADTEPNNTFETAEVIGEGTYHGTFYYSFWNSTNNDDTDYYLIHIPAHKMLNVRVISDYGLSVSATIYSQNRTMKDFAFCSDGDAADLREDPFGEAETVYLKLESTIDTGNYTLEVTFSDSAFEDISNGITAGAFLCLGSILLIVILIIVAVVLIVKGKKPKQPQYPTYPPQPQYPPYIPPQYPAAPPDTEDEDPPRKMKPIPIKKKKLKKENL